MSSGMNLPANKRQPVKSRRKTIVAVCGAMALAGASFVPKISSPAWAQQTRSQAAKPISAAKARKLRQQRLAPVKSWGYQLRFVNPQEVRESPYDLIVVDHAISANRRFQRQITRDEIETMKQRPDGSRRIVLSYLSIGEAERYRFYWNQDWYNAKLAPPWLGKVNPQWDGNYLVRFWDPAWQSIVFGGADNYLDRIKKQGFDGIYLDRADVYWEWRKERPSAEKDMVTFIDKLARAAHKRDPRFLVVMQNAEELVRFPKLRQAIDGIAKEDLFFGVNHSQEKNSAEDVRWSLKWLRRAKQKGKKVFVVEYLNNRKLAAATMKRIARMGFLPHAAPRGLGSLWFPGRDF